MVCEGGYVMGKLDEYIAKLVQYGLETELITKDETIYATNLLLERI